MITSTKLGVTAIHESIHVCILFWRSALGHFIGPICCEKWTVHAHLCMMLCVPLMMLCIYFNVLHAYTPIMMLRLVTIDGDAYIAQPWRVVSSTIILCMHMKKVYSTLQCVSYRFCAYMVCSTLMCDVWWTSLDVWCNRPWCCELYQYVCTEPAWCRVCGVQVLFYDVVSRRSSLSNVGPYIHDLSCWVSIYIYSIMIGH